MNALARRLEAQRNAAVEAAEGMARRGEDRELSLNEGAVLEETLQAAERAAARLAIVQPPSPTPVVIRREALTYEQGGPESFFRDMARAKVRGDGEAARRLERHGAEMRVEVPKREARRRAEFELLAAQGRWGIERRALSRTDGAGGDFVPPIWLSDLFAPAARAGRVLAALSRNIGMPVGTDNITIPRVTTGATTGPQLDNAAVANTDMVTAGVACPVRSIAGAADVAMQLLEQGSPLGFDEVMYVELLADYNAQLAAELVNGSGAAGQLSGVLGVATAAGNTVAYTDGTPTVPEFWSKAANAAAQSGTNRHLPPTAVLCTPARWFWVAGALDAQNRPLVPPSTEPPEADELGQTIAEGANGTIVSLPAYMESAIPTNFGAGANEDRVLVVRPSDFLLFESEARMRVTLDNATSGSAVLGAKVTLYRYVAFTSALYPSGLSVVAGTGLTTPAFL
jgi:HK97 family phage major capsid protein